MNKSMSSVPKVNLIKAPIAEEMQQFEPFFRASVKSSVPLLDLITNYIIRRKGKQMRPMFVFLSAKLNGTVNESSYNAACFIELLHTATLIHDDVVDEAYQRRGFFSINALWKSKVAVLVGDFMLSKGLLLAVDRNEFDFLRVVSNAVKEMSEGELLQIEKARRQDITEEVYFEIIRKKTATLIAACAASGAKSVGANAETVENMRLFGEYVGMAFQVRDDLFDYEKTNLTGKPVGNDIQEKKLTLPLIYALDQSDAKERKWARTIIKKHNKNSAKVAELVHFVVQKGGIEYSLQVMEGFKQKAMDILATYPDSPSKLALQELVRYTTERNK